MRRCCGNFLVVGDSGEAGTTEEISGVLDEFELLLKLVDDTNFDGEFEGDI